MTLLSSAWSAASLSTKAQAVRLVTAAEALVQAFGAAPTNPPTVESSSDDVAAWERRYEQAASTVDAPSIDTLTGIPVYDGAVLAWNAVERYFTEAPQTVRSAVSALRSAYAARTFPLTNVTNDALIRNWLVQRAQRAGWRPDQAATPSPIRRPVSNGTLVLIGFALWALSRR